MIESLFILFIIFLFIIPIPTLSLALGLAIGHIFYKQFLLLRHQPAKHKSLVWYTLLCSAINLSSSLILAFALSYAVYYFLTDLSWLFIFNFLFCLLISVRWFDFSNYLFRYLIHRLSEQHTQAIKTTGPSTFVMIYGLRKSIGWGAGWTPVFVDAADIDLGQEPLRVKGLFLDLNLDSENIENAGPVSSEQISFNLRQSRQQPQADRFKLVVRDQFYPFRCRETRDLLLSRICPPQVVNTDRTYPLISTNNPTPG